MHYQRTLGIMTIHSAGEPPFPEASFFQQMSKKGIEEGIPVVVFHPNEVNFKIRKVNGYQFDLVKGWNNIMTAIPDYIYDRCFYIGKNYNTLYKPHVQKLLTLSGVQFLGVGLKGKWQLYQLLKSHPTLSGFLPPTEKVNNLSQIEDWLGRGRSIMLKPINGSLGVGIIKVSKLSSSEIVIEGRDYKNVPYTQTVNSISSVSRLIKPSITNFQYLIQPYLTLSTKEGVPFDVRVFTQKNETGEWSVTGRAVRVGKKDSITSNLHGGGKAAQFEAFLNTHYPPDLVGQILSRISILEKQLPTCLEKNHGPLVELGIDIGIDRKGKVWLIEVNSRPGRDIFRQIGDKTALSKSQLNPLYYAKYLMQSHTVPTEGYHT